MALKEIIFWGTGCGRPTIDRQLPAYLLRFENNHGILLECGIQPTLDPKQLNEISSIDTLIITAPDSELIAGLPGFFHTQRLLNRERPLRIIAPESIKSFLDVANEIDTYPLRFDTNFVPIDEISIDLESGISLTFSKVGENHGKFQVVITCTDQTEHQTMIYYTGKSRGIEERCNPQNKFFIIHDCTYFYEDGNLANVRELSDYKSALDFAQQRKPDMMFLVHISARYERTDLQRPREHDPRVLLTEDNLRFDCKKMTYRKN